MHTFTYVVVTLLLCFRRDGSGEVPGTDPGNYAFPASRQFQRPHKSEISQFAQSDSWTETLPKRVGFVHQMFLIQPTTVTNSH